MKAVFIYFSISNVNYDYEDIWFLFPFRMFLSYIYIYIEKDVICKWVMIHFDFSLLLIQSYKFNFFFFSM